MIRDIGETLKDLFKDSFRDAGFTTVTVSNERPRKDNVKSFPTLSAYMYHLAFAPGYAERSESLVTSNAKDGRITEYYQDAPAYMHAQYILSVWGNTPNEENVLLGLTVKTLLENAILTGDRLRGESLLPDDKLNIFPNLQADFNESLAFWRSLNEEIRPSLFYYVKFRVESDRRSKELTRVTGRDLAFHAPPGGVRRRGAP